MLLVVLLHHDPCLVASVRNCVPQLRARFGVTRQYGRYELAVSAYK